MKSMLIIDVETTGLSPSSDEIIEFAGLLFEYDENSKIVGQILDTYSGLREPGCPISPQAQKVNRITDEMVRGQKLDDQRVLTLFASADIVISHNVKFDRDFLVRLYPAIASKSWRCSMNDIDWDYKGHRYKSLQKLSKDYSIKIPRSAAHRALADCQTVYQLLAHEDNLQELLCGLDARTISLSRSSHDLYPVQVECENKFFRNLNEIVQYYDDDEGCDEDWHEAFLFYHEQPYDLDHHISVKINNLTVGYLKPSNAKNYLKRLASLGVPTNMVGHCYASIRGGKIINGFKTSLGVRLDFDLKEFEIKPYTPQIVTRRPLENEERPANIVEAEAKVASAVQALNAAVRKSQERRAAEQATAHEVETKTQAVASSQSAHLVMPKTKEKIKFGGKMPLIPMNGKGWAYWLIIFPFVAVINLYILLFVGIWYVVKWLLQIIMSSIEK